MRIQPGGLRKKAMLVVRIDGHQTSNEIFDRVQPDRWMALLKFRFAHRDIAADRLERLPGQTVLQSGQILDGSRFAELHALPHSFQMQHARCDDERAAAGGGGFRCRLHIEFAENDVFGIQFLADFHDRRFG